MVPLITEYLQKRLYAFDFYYQETKKTFDIEALHKLRVEIKKQRAFFRFLEELSGGGFTRKSHFRVLSRVFKVGGRLRETHVNQSLIKLYRSYSLDGYKYFLEKKNKRQTKKLGKQLRKFDLSAYDRLNEELIELLSQTDFHFLEEKARDFINRELETIRNFRPLIAGDKELHQIRTHTKALGYIAKFVNELNPNEYVQELLRKAKPTEKLIGNWHDRLVLRHSLERYLVKKPEASDKQEVDKLICQINSRNKTAVQIITNRLDGFININL